jgi:LysR family transcriptional regulator, transcriptional activator of nhaA
MKGPPRPVDFHKLRYFWHAARAGSVAGAARELAVAQPTVTAHLRDLERQLGGALFLRSRRGLSLTALGDTTLRFAEQIFALGTELQRAAAGAGDRELLVGVSDAVPKPVVRSILLPVLKEVSAVRVECREWRSDILLDALGSQRLDVVISDVPPAQDAPWRFLTYEVGQTAVCLLGAPPLASRARRGFPRSLSGMPMVLPVRESGLRRWLDAWFDANRLIPRIVAEADDRALINHLGQAGVGLFPAGLLLERETSRQFQVARVGLLRGVRERYYVVTTARRIRHPAVAVLCRRARQQFAAASRADAEP